MASGLRWSEDQLQAARKRLQPRPLVRAEDQAALLNAAAAGAAKVKQVNRNKYGNVKTERDGVTYDSAKESRVLAELEMRERAGHIRDLRRQVQFAIVVNQIHICDFIADAVYQEGARRVVIDVKSDITRKNPVYRLKRKLLAAVLGIEVEER